jgi:hypothetical protein
MVVFFIGKLPCPLFFTPYSAPFYRILDNFSNLGFSERVRHLAPGWICVGGRLYSCSPANAERDTIRIYSTPGESDLEAAVARLAGD